MNSSTLQTERHLWMISHSDPKNLISVVQLVGVVLTLRVTTPLRPYRACWPKRTAATSSLAACSRSPQVDSAVGHEMASSNRAKNGQAAWALIVFIPSSVIFLVTS